MHLMKVLHKCDGSVYDVVVVVSSHLAEVSLW